MRMYGHKALPLCSIVWLQHCLYIHSRFLEWCCRNIPCHTNQHSWLLGLGNNKQYFRKNRLYVILLGTQSNLPAPHFFCPSGQGQPPSAICGLFRVRCVEKRKQWMRKNNLWGKAYLCTRGHGSIRTIACFVDSTVAANAAADPGSRKALHLIISTRATISIIFCAYLRVMANILSAPIAAYICHAISNAAIH